MTRKHHTQTIYRNLKQSHLVFLKGSHFITSENSAAFNDCVFQFLEDYAQ